MTTREKILQEGLEKLADNLKGVPILADFARETLAKADAVEDGKDWFEVDSTPETMKEVLCLRGNRRFIGMLVGEKQLEASLEYEGDDSEYDEDSDCFWCRPGWYEQAPEHDAVSWWRVDSPTHWQPLPEAPK